MKQKLLPLFPKHGHYAEVFGGGASVLFYKPPSIIETYNDLDSAVVDFFRVLQDASEFKEFQRLCYGTPYSRELFREFDETWHTETERVRRVWKWFVTAKQAFGGEVPGARKKPSFGVSRCATASNKRLSAFYGTIERLPECVERFWNVQIENLDFRRFIPKYDEPECLMYMDPPYVHATRKSGGYRFEMADDEHCELLDMIKTAKSKIILSGYPNEVYDKHLDWPFLDFEIICHSAAMGKAGVNKRDAEHSAMRVERVWFNFKMEETLPLWQS